MVSSVTGSYNAVEVDNQELSNTLSCPESPWGLLNQVTEDLEGRLRRLHLNTIVEITATEIGYKFFMLELLKLIFTTRKQTIFNWNFLHEVLL